MKQTAFIIIALPFTQTRCEGGRRRERGGDIDIETEKRENRDRVDRERKKEIQIGKKFTR